MFGPTIFVKSIFSKLEKAVGKIPDTPVKCYDIFVKELIARGVDVDERDCYEDTAVVYACKLGHADVLKVCCCIISR